MVPKSAFEKKVIKQWEAFSVASQYLNRINLWGPPGIGKTYGASRYDS